MNATCQHCGNEQAGGGNGNNKLTPCPDCGGYISKRAQTCPHCGAVFQVSAPVSAKVISDDFASEKEVAIYHPSGMNFLWEIIIGIITIPLIVGIVMLIYVWVQINFTTYTITTLRVIARQGWLSKRQDEIWIKDMRGVNLVQGVWQRMIGIGTISIGTAATAGTEMSMIGIANPQAVVDCINALRQG